LYGTPGTSTVNGTKVLTFNGLNQYAGVTGGFGTIMDTASGYSYEIWTSVSTRNSSSTLITEWSNNTFNSGWTNAQMGFQNNAKIAAGYYNTSTPTYATSISNYSINTWYNIMFTYNGSNQGTLYVNGVSQGTTGVVAKSNASPATYLSLGLPDNAGTYLGGMTGYFIGSIGVWRAYNIALTASQVNANFLAFRSRYGV
jgi:hypothetical protein